MKQITLTIPDDFYPSLVEFCKDNPEVSIHEREENEVPLWQQELVLERIKNAKPEDYIDATFALERLKNKYGI